MIPKNKLTDICATLTLVILLNNAYMFLCEKAKEDFTKECAGERAQNQHHHEHANNEQYGHCSKKQKDATSSGLLTDENSDDEEIRKWREKRLMQLKKKQEMKKDGVYVDISEKEFIPTVCHFYDNNFKRCEILHSHLIKLANIHPCTKFIKVEAKNCLFFMNKLNIKILPSLCLFIDGVLTKTCTGFEDFGNKDEFKTKDLEMFLFKKKLISNMELNESDDED
ncbi:phosducin-like protein, putative (PhLP2) [Plasmodium ovale curtisi]|uniref:Phosducin-like protein, putative (PhLP2) n=1 Tax=Plasmodium ovale curtisi TaxID=864141 RepID=A0A1A8VXM0_PLAOA|nr:phosducin-like protein, putative (PhLP2) [Plasmodium ovale curtisi]